MIALLESNLITLGAFVILLLCIFILLSYTLRLKKKYLTQKKLEQEERLKINNSIDFITTLSHELRTPLYAVTAISKSLLEDSPRKDQEEDLKILNQASSYLVKLINDALLIKKIDENKLNLQQEVFDLSQLLNQVCQTVKKQVSAAHTPIHFNVVPKTPHSLIGDALKITQILINLLNNAIKFGNQNPIDLTVKCLEETEKDCILSFSVKDRGMGIKEKEQAKVLERFYQLGNKAKAYGSGLGLSIVVQLLKIMNSELKLKSKENHGSKFSFNLHLKKADVTTLNTSINLSPTQLNNLRGMRILVVDDNLVNQRVTIKALQNIGVVGVSCDNGEKAIQLIKEEPFDGVLMDLLMPEMTGQESTQVIRSFNSEIPIVALTAVDKEKHWKELSLLGFNTILNKPYEQKDLYRVLVAIQEAAKRHESLLHHL